MTRFQRISRRERWMLLIMGLCILGVMAFSVVWQPVVQRLADSERQHQHQLVLAAQLQQAQRQGVRAPVSVQPLSSRVSESAAVAKLEIQQMDSDGDVLHLALSGDAQALLTWLDRIEREGVGLQSLSLEKRNHQLWARAILTQPP